MKAHLKCKCGATCWTSGEDEPDVNCFSIDFDYPCEWEGGIETCEHDDIEITETEDEYFSSEYEP